MTSVLFIEAQQWLEQPLPTWSEEPRLFSSTAKLLCFHGDDDWSKEQYASLFLIGVELNPGPKVSKGSRRSGKSQRGVMVMTPIERFESNLASQSDAFNLKGKLLIPIGSVGTSPTLIFPLIPSNMGARATALGVNFSRYRINRLWFKFFPDGANPATVMGIVDDSSAETGDVPTTTSGLLELRCSGVALAGQTVPTIVEYKRLDNLWRYCQAGASGDPRLYNQAAFYMAVSAAAGAVTVEMDFDITFKGAISVGST